MLSGSWSVEREYGESINPFRSRQSLSGIATQLPDAALDLFDFRRLALGGLRDLRDLLGDPTGAVAGVVDHGSDLADRIPPEDADAFERVMTAAAHTKELTEAVGDLAEILGTTDPELEPIALDEILQ